MSRKLRKRLYKALAILLVLFLYIYFLQHIWAHRKGLADNVECIKLLGWFTMEDRISKEGAVPPKNLQPGDILVTLSTHSLGWRHGHVGLVLDSETVLECVTLGEKSRVVKTKHWGTYSNYAVLRVKNVTQQQQQEVADYAKEALCGVPYHLTAGLIGKKDRDIDGRYFGMQCAYLAWYAWNQFDYDLDSDGGRLVTAQDLLNSDAVEIVESFGEDFTL